MNIEIEDGKFCELHPPLDLHKAKLEASRCYFCFDAPCVTACPTSIDIPSFIRKISTGNLTGSAKDILKENIMGGTCSRVCPVESLCQGSCVRNTDEDKPVEIGLLQRFATDRFFASSTDLFEKEKSTGKTVAVVGGGPAGLSCAHGLALLGHNVEIFEAQSKLGGLNEYGLAPYKMVDDFAQREIEFILSIENIKTHTGQRLGDNVQLDDLRSRFDAVFLSMGLGDVNSLGIDGENLKGVHSAVDYISDIRQASDLSKLPMGRHIIVIGGGSTAVDIAIETKKLGAETVSIVYRKGEEQMPATWYERETAQKNGVLVRTWAKPISILGDDKVSGVRFESTKDSTDSFELQADMVFKAIGQRFQPAAFTGCKETPEMDGRKIKINDDFETNLTGVFAGGDCITSVDLTVQAVNDGKEAAASIHKRLLGGQHG